ncbi:hypothetical protein ABRV10_005116 [Citrobacter amalonaticus]|uniref:hypothetical protein n=1 Tax=Citrobacter TaxID=544 RepID=UPI0007334AB3|nr:MULTISPECIES: hypothetical protein [Citrobacter]PNP33422.1 hypothetical protein AL525_005830 [Citrobacter amalonaticus]
MKFSDILIIGIILGVGYTYFFSNTEAPSVNENLITQFDKRDVIKRSEWSEGKVIDGIQIYTASKDYTLANSIWMLGKDEAAVTVLTEGKQPEFEATFIVSQCNQLAMVVTDKEASTVKNDVMTIFKSAFDSDKDKDGVLRASGEISGRHFDVSVRKLGSVSTFSCGIKTA